MRVDETIQRQTEPMRDGTFLRARQRTAAQLRPAYIDAATNARIHDIRDRVAQLRTHRPIRVYRLADTRNCFACRTLTQLGGRALNFSRRYIIHCATEPLKWNSTPGLHRPDPALALERLRSTAGERSIIRNRNR